MRGHAQQLTDGDDAGAAHTCDHDAVAAGVDATAERGQFRRWQCAQVLGLRQAALVLLTPLAAFDRNEAGAKPFDAALVFVASALVDAAFAAEFGFQGLDAQAIALTAAVAAAFAHRFIDDDADRGVHHGAALAATAFFSGTGLVVNDDGAAQDAAHGALHPVQFVAVFNRHALGQTQHATRDAVVSNGRVFFGLVGDDDDVLGAFGPHALRNLNHTVPLGTLAHGLAAGHGNGVVVQNFVGDVDTRCHALAHRQQAAVEVSAVADVGKNMLVVAERLLADPRHALAAHLGEAHGAAVHPQAHEMAANASHGA